MKNHDLAGDLERAETVLRYALACREWLERDVWKTVEASLLAEENAATEHLIQGLKLASVEGAVGGQGGTRIMRQMTAIESAELRGGIKAMRFLRSLPRMKADQVDSLRREIDHLRNAIERGQNAPETKESPQMAAFRNDLNGSLGARR